jgi:hypothetical protein
MATKHKTTRAEALAEAKALDAELKDLRDIHDHAQTLGFRLDINALQTQINAVDRRLVKLADTYNLWGNL